MPFERLPEAEHLQSEPITRSPRAMLVIAVMTLGFWAAVGVGLWIAFN